MIKEFDNKRDYKKFVMDKTKHRKVGWGTEGNCYLGNDYLVYKVIDTLNDYIPDNIITSDDYNFKHIAFPIDIFTNSNHDMVYGYNTVFLNNNMFYDFGDDLEDIDIDKLVENYYDMMEEVKLLSNDKILMYDMINNLLFNNELLLAIDTLYYRTVDSDTFEDNKDLLLKSITIPLNVYFGLRAKLDEVNSIEYIAEKVKKRGKQRKSNYISY